MLVLVWTYPKLGVVAAMEMKRVSTATIYILLLIKFSWKRIAAMDIMPALTLFLAACQLEPMFILVKVVGE
jgi:hypothetical protein